MPHINPSKMSEEFEGEFSENLTEILASFESMLSKNEVYFFDVEQFEDIFDHYYSKNKISKAERSIRIGLMQHPFSNELKLRLVQIYIKKKKYNEALALLREIETTEAFNPDIYILRAEIYGDLEKTDLAVENYLKALEFLDKEEHDYIYIDIANEYQNSGDFENSLKYLKKALRLNPTNEMAFLEVLFCFQVTEKLIEGADFFNQLINQDPYNQLAWFHLGLCYYDLGLYDKSVEAFDYCIVINENSYEAYSQKAEGLIAMENYSSAIEVLKELLDKDRISALTYYTLGECYENLEDLENALHYYRLSVKENDGFSDGYLGIGSTLYKMNRRGEGVHFIEKAIKIDPQNVDANFELAKIKHGEGLYKEALDLCEKIIDIDNSFPEFWIQYSETLFESGDELGAIEMVQEGIKIFPNSAELRFRLAAFYHTTGKLQQAYEFIHEGLALDYAAMKSFFQFVPYAVQDQNILNIIESYNENEN